ncbi:hypothetical protein NW767_013337 [Fusarium falciforme]|nr:hypothetical protein NW767_013337 [Fusarium falciforme]
MAEEVPPVATTAMATETSSSGSSSAAPTSHQEISSDSTAPTPLGNQEKSGNSRGKDPRGTNGVSERDTEPVQEESLHEKHDQESKNGDEDGDTPEEEVLPEKERPLTTEVRYYNYQGFMNRMDGDDGDYVIEVLVARADWHEDVKAETKKRPQRSHPENNYKTKGISGAQLKLPRGSKSPQEGRIQRIRIRSETILRALGSLAECEEIETEPTLEFSRPFRILEEFHGGMKKKLVEMENAHKPQGDSPSTGLGSLLPGTAGVRSDESIEMERPKVSGEDTGDVLEANETDKNSSRSTETALEHMRCYVDFVEQVVLPIRSKFQHHDKKTRRRVRYEEIPYLFHPGSLAFLPLAQSGQTLHRSAAQQVWRMASCIVSDHSTDFDEEKECFLKNSGETSWGIYCLDYDGEKLFPVWRNVEFDFFNGERDITSLKCYPLEFHPNYAALLEEQRKLGQTFKSCIAESVRHLYYSGWTFITGIREEPLVDDKGEIIKYPEYVESEVVIDFKETLRNYPQWETSVGECETQDTSWETTGYAEMELRVWEEYPNGLDSSRRFRSEAFLILSREDTLYHREAKEWADNDRFIVGDGAIAIKDDEWTDEELAILPKRLFGYVLRERRFARLEVQGIDMNSQQSRVTLDDIQMPAPRRKMIRSAVSAHFRARQKEKQGQSTIQLDVVQGKGKGLVILLHGAPGVGKTATAEAVAIENSKPLFPITCGDLGFSPSAVDKSLRDTFRYAHLWDCVLLLDEADVFLTQRDRSSGNLERNALVGVFLRVLEYYSGILFLTTNRVGALDEAFRSRVHLSLCYPHLSLNDTIAILQSNLNRLPRIEHAKDKSSNDGYIKVLDSAIKKILKGQQKKKGPWNGRQIRNAVQIAADLALYDKEAAGENDGLPAILTADHFRSVAETTSEFEAYLKSTKKGDETFQARVRQDRDDDFQEEEEAEEYARYSGHSDAKPFGGPQRPKLKSSVSGPPRTRQRGASRVPSTPDRSRTPASLHADGASGNYFRSSKSSPGPAHSGQRPRHAPHEPECSDVAENMQGELSEEEELEERGYGYSPESVSRGSRPLQFGKKSDRYVWD